MHEVPCRLDPMAQPADHLQFLGRRRRRGRRRTVWRPHHRNCNIRTATTDSTPSIGSSASAVSNRKSSSPQPVFSTWWKSSIRGRRRYDACLREFRLGLHRQRAEQVPLQRLLDPRRRLGLRDPLDPHRDWSPLGMTGLPDRRDLDPDLGCRHSHRAVRAGRPPRPGTSTVLETEAGNEPANRFR